MTTDAVRVTGVTKRFADHVAVRDLSFTVPAGVVFGVLGPNGAGKSTTLRMVNDIIAPDGGEIRILDKFAPGRDAAPHIGYLPEERGLYPKMKVVDMLTFMAELRGVSIRDAKLRAGKWLERLGLTQWTRNKVQDLSKGMQQKVQFAAAVIHDPELVILDEPWSGLDPINAEVLREVVAEQKAAGRTILFSTHQMEQAEKICDHVCIIARGAKVLDGPLVDVKRAAVKDGLVALAFIDEAARAAAEPVLADRSLILARRPPRPGDTADLEVELAAGAAPEKLLRELVATGAAITRFEVVVPTLHQIFVERVGAENAAVAAHTDGAA
ncbi:MAG: ATP-binding cassette domain-containing protein [Deltaproteobacteria bacterium]|nr:ATP-binding cassette domain-containing protein [Deltaproteobacteria bacterium]